MLLTFQEEHVLLSALTTLENEYWDLKTEVSRHHNRMGDIECDIEVLAENLEMNIEIEKEEEETKS